MPTCRISAGQTAHYFTLQIEEHAARPDVLVLGQEESRDSFDGWPLRQELSAGIKHLDTPVLPVGDVDLALRVDDYVMRQLELSRARASAAELENVLPIVRELHDARASVPVGHVEIAIGCEAYI